MFVINLFYVTIVIIVFFVYKQIFSCSFLGWCLSYAMESDAVCFRFLLFILETASTLPTLWRACYFCVNNFI